MKHHLSDPDLPALFRAADSASRAGQRVFLGLVASDLTLLVFGAALSLFGSSGPGGTSSHAVIGAVLLFIGLLVTGGLWLSEFERTWYGARAVAESVKTLSWRYVMGAEPYSHSGKLEEIDKRFLADLQEILKERKHLSWTFGGELANEPQITGNMREVRALGLSEKKNIYAADRLGQQQSWYARKSKSHTLQERFWFGAFFLAQLGAFICALCAINSPAKPNYTGVLAALSSAFLTWIQANKLHELAQAYGLTAHELGMVKEKASHIKSNDALSEFVSDAENAISREHTMWVARRDR